MAGESAIRFAAVAGTVVLAGGVGMAVYGRFVAAPVVTKHRIDGRDALGAYTDLAVDAVPGRLGNAALVLGVLAGAAAVVMARRALRGRGIYGEWEWTIPVAVALGIVVPPLLAFFGHAGAALGHLRAERPLTTGIPAVVAAGALVVAGCLLLMPAAVLPTFLRPPAGWRGLILPVVSGGVVVAVAAGLVVWAGDDGRAIDHRTVPAGQAPPVPAAVSGERYRLTVGEPPGEGFGDVVVAGAGFVTATASGVVARDGRTGAELWHYRRAGGSGIDVVGDTLQALSDDVVLVSWEQRGWIALDARTGDVLWRDADYGRDLRPGDWKVSREWWHQELPGPLVRVEERPDHSHTRLTYYDSRSGMRRWSASADDGGCAAPFTRFVATPAMVHRVTACAADAELRLATLDARTGAVVATRTVRAAAQPATSVDTDRIGEHVLVEWGETELLLSGSGAVEPMPGAVGLVAGDAAGVMVHRSDALELIGLDSSRRSVSPWLLLGEGWALLGDTVVRVVRDGADVRLEAARREDGAPGPALPVDIDAERCATPRPVAVPGALLIRCGATLIGYG